MTDDRYRDAWNAQTLEGVDADTDRLRRDAALFARQIRRRNVRELVAVGFITLAFGGTGLLSADAGVRVACAAVVLVAWLVAAVIALAGPDVPPDPALPTARFVEARRASLLRQARLLAWAPLWYVAPLWAATTGFALAVGGRGAGVAVIVVLIAAFHAVLAGWNLKAAAALRDEAARVG
jgi:hypothetical protein